MKRKPTNLPRYKSGWNQWKYFAEPKTIYFGGGLHYINKEGKFTHAKSSEMFEDIKSKIMTKEAFKKKFGHLLNDEKYMGFLKKIKAIV